MNRHEIDAAERDEVSERELDGGCAQANAAHGTLRPTVKPRIASLPATN